MDSVPAADFSCASSNAATALEKPSPQQSRAAAERPFSEATAEQSTPGPIAMRLAFLEEVREAGTLSRRERAASVAGAASAFSTLRPLPRSGGLRVLPPSPLSAAPVEFQSVRIPAYRIAVSQYSSQFTIDAGFSFRDGFRLATGRSASIALLNSSTEFG